MRLEDVDASDAEAFAASFISATKGAKWMTLDQARRCIVQLWEMGWELEHCDPKDDA